MRCTHCSAEMEKTDVRVYGASALGKAMTCPKCGFTKFDKKSSGKIIRELRKNEDLLVRIPAKMAQRANIVDGYKVCD